VALGVVGGALGGLVCALGDFGASWLWVPDPGDRAELGARLGATLVPAGAVAGGVVALVSSACVAIVHALAWRMAPDRRARLAVRAGDALVAVLAAPLFAWAASTLLSGPRARTLAHHDLAVGGLTAAMALGAWIALAAGRRAVDVSQRRPSVGLALAVVSFAAAAGAAKIDQLVLPGLYGAFHGLCAAVAFALGAVGGLCAIHGLGGPPGIAARRPLATLAAVLAVLGGAIALHATTIAQSPNVAVALFDPRASTSRSLSFAIAPLLRRDEADLADAIARARADRAERLALLHDGSLPTWSGAHVLLVTIDALRADHTGPYGYTRGITPHLDRLAADAVVFERAYAQAPHSSYSLCSLMTSEYLHETVDLAEPLPHSTLPRAVAAHGYRTAAFYLDGIFHTEGERLVQYRDDAFGFEVHDHRDETAEQKTDRVLDVIDRTVAEGEPPTLVWVHYFDVHEPYTDTSLGTSPVDRYDGEIRLADHAIGELVHDVDERFERDVIVVLGALSDWSDRLRPLPDGPAIR
jgi:hypothetical protein